MINGYLVPGRTFANAIEVGQHGYFYESTWLDLYVTPDYHVGEILGHDEENNTFTMEYWRIGRRDYHHPECQDVELDVPYTDETQFLIEGELSDRDTVLNRRGNFVQSHPPREQIIMLESAGKHFDPTLYGEKGGRWGANSYSTMGTYQSYDPKKKINYFMRADGNQTGAYAKPSEWVLDGKLLRHIDLYRKPGRSASLAHYRGGKAPEMVYMRTMDDEIRGEVTAVDGSDITIQATDWDGKTSTQVITIDPAGKLYVDGVSGQSADAVVVGQRIRIFPKRPQTIVALLMRSIITEGYKRKIRIAAEGFRPVASFRSPQRIAIEQEVTFDARSSHVFDEDNIVSYEWDFDDGNTASGEVVQHTFATDRIGRYDVTLTVTDSRGLSRSITRHVVVYPEIMPPARATSEGLQRGSVNNSGPNKQKMLLIFAVRVPMSLLSVSPNMTLFSPDF